MPPRVPERVSSAQQIEPGASQVHPKPEHSTSREHLLPSLEGMAFLKPDDKGLDSTYDLLYVSKETHRW